MIPNIQVSRYETNVHNTQHAFTIEMTPTLAKLLSSQTYTDKVLAAIREPLSNAYDSHVRAGTLDTPAKLHLPTVLEPQFSLRDFGTGLDHSDVVRLFFSYGVSDKRETNTELGGLGIGAKAFFAYVDQATITSYHNGTKRVYSASKAANGLPQGMLVSETTTDEPNGIELSYPVQARHVESFREKTEHLLTHLRLKVESNVKLTPHKVEEFYSCDLDTTVGTAHCVLRTKREDNLVVMGGIAYSIPFDVDYGHANSKYQRSYHNDGVIIYLPIGSVEISASRESLSPTDADKDLIVDLLHMFHENVRGQDWTKMIQESETWLAAVGAREYLGYMSVIGGDKILELDEKYKWRGISTRAKFIMPDLSMPVAAVYRYSWRSNKYRSETYGTDYANRKVSKVYWMPKGKKISWAKWYEQHRTLRVGGGGDIDLHIRTETIDEAKELAEMIGITAEVEDGSFLKTQPRARTKTVNARPTGIAWINGEKKQLDDYSEDDLIYSSDPIPDIEWMYGNKLITSRPVWFKPFGVNAESAAKRFAHLPKTLLEWCQRNPDKIDMEKWIHHERMRQLHEAWKPDWMTISKAVQVGDQFGFTLPVSWNHRHSLPALIDPPDASDLIAAARQWHDNVFAKLPPTIRKLLRDELDYYSRSDTYIALYKEMST